MITMMKMMLILFCVLSGGLAVGMIPELADSGAGKIVQDAKVGLTEMTVIRHSRSMRWYPERSCAIRLYCVFPCSGELAPDQLKHNLQVVDSNGREMRIESIQLSRQSVRGTELRHVECMILLKAMPAPGVRWLSLRGDLVIPMSGGFKILDCGEVELLEEGRTLVLPDPVTEQELMEGSTDVADMGRVGTLSLKVTKLKLSERTGRLRKEAKGDEWKFMVYAKSSFRLENFIFRDAKGDELNIPKTCTYTENGHHGLSFLFNTQTRFVNVEVKYQGPAQIYRIPVNFRLGLGGVMPPAPVAPGHGSGRSQWWRWSVTN